MTAVQEVPAAARQERVSADLPGELAKRLRTWAAFAACPSAMSSPNWSGVPCPPPTSSPTRSVEVPCDERGALTPGSRSAYPIPISTRPRPGTARGSST